MRNLSTLTALTALIAIGLAAGASAQTCPNSCVAALDGPVQGAHAQFFSQADVILWPPNHKLRTVSISAENQQSKPCNVTITDVRQDEPVNGEGSGSTSPDAANCKNAGDVSYVDLRGERSGTLKTGRFYTIVFDMSDPDCPILPSEDNTAEVLVPHDQGVAHADLWVNEGPLYESGATEPITCTP